MGRRRNGYVKLRVGDKIAGKVYVVKYEVFNPYKSIIIDKRTVRDGGQLVFKKLPISKEELEQIDGVTVNYVDADKAEEIYPEHPRAEMHKALEKKQESRYQEH